MDLKELGQKLNKEFIESLSPTELTDFLIESTLLIPTYEFHTQPLSEERKKAPDLKFDEIAKEIDMDSENNKFFYPVYDEREENIFKKALFGKEYDRIPAKGYFKYLKSAHLQKMFGIVEVTVDVGRITKKDADWRHPHFDVKTEVEKYVYDFESNEFSIVLKTKKKNTRLELLLKEREELLQLALNQLSSVEIEYLEHFDDLFSNYFNYTTEKKNEFLIYFNKYKGFLEDLHARIGYKMIFSNITISEYTKIKDKMKEFINDIDTYIKKITDYEEKHQKQLEDVDLRNGDKHSDEYELYNELLDFKKKLVAFITARTEKGSSKTPKMGYFLIDDEHMYPNLAEIERRSYFTTGMMNMDKELKVQQEMRKAYEQNKQSTSTEEPEKQKEVVLSTGMLFTEEQINEMKGKSYSKRLDFAWSLPSVKALDMDQKMQLKDNLKKGKYGL